MYGSQSADPGIPGSLFELATLDEKAALNKFHDPNDPSFLDEAQAQANAANKKDNFEIFNSLRYYIPRPLEDSLLESSVYNPLEKNLSPPPPPAPNPPLLASVRTGGSDALFNFGDLITLNARPARRDALLGAGVFSAAKYVLPKGATVLILTDPTKASVTDAGTQPLTQANLEPSIEKYGRWYFDLYSVAGPGGGPSGTPLTSLPMVEIRVQWVFQATFDPKASGLPLLQITEALPPQAAEVSAASQPTASQTPAAGVPLAGGVDTSSDFTQIIKAASGPGVNLFAGQNFQSNATPSIFGVILSHGDQKSATPQGSSSGASFTSTLGRWLDSTGILVGKTTGSHGAYVLGLSKSINSSASFYAGPAFSDSGGTVRTDFSFGVALNLTPIVSDKNSQQAPTTFTISAGTETFEKNLGLQASQAAILWTTALANVGPNGPLAPPDPSEAASNMTFTVDQSAATSQPDPFGFSRDGQPTNYWVSYVLPGKLTDVSMTVKSTTATGQRTLKWSEGTLQLFEIVGGNQTQTPILYDKAEGFPLEAGQITNIEIKPVPSGHAMAKPAAASKSAGRTGIPHTRRLASFNQRQAVARTAPAPVAYLHRLPFPAPSSRLLTQAGWAAPPAVRPLVGGHGGGVSDLTGAISPPQGVSLDQITLELRASPNSRVLLSAQLPFLPDPQDRKPDHFRIPLSVPGNYYLCITAHGKRLYPPIPVAPGTRLPFIDIPNPD